MKRFVKLFAINAVVIGFLLSALNLGAIATLQLYHLFDKNEKHLRVHLPNYEGAPWAQGYFDEDTELRVRQESYHAFIGWRQDPFTGDHLNIDERGMRRTVNQTSKGTKVAAFFGGSAIWGEGADDARTIPSLFAAIHPDYHALNFGEIGFVAHQSLNLITEAFSNGMRPDLVVFYDGSNDVYFKCRTTSDLFSHGLENEVRLTLRDFDINAPESFDLLILPLKRFAESAVRTIVSRSTPDEDLWNCDQSPEKAADVARYLISDWWVAKQIVEGYGGRFLAILQPTAYVSQTRKDHISLKPEVAEQFDAVYPKVRELLEVNFPELKSNFIDLSDAFDRDEYIYIDFAHVSPNGNRIIAERISRALAERQKTPMASGSSVAEESLCVELWGRCSDARESRIGRGGGGS
jgi:hypothetical protein